MKKVKYEFVTGEVAEIEVSDYWAEVLKELDREEYNINHKETRRHCTISRYGDQSYWLTDEKSDPAEIVTTKIMLEEGLDSLTECQREVVVSVYQLGLSVSEYAEMKGISLSAAYCNLERAKNNLKNFLEA